MTKAWSLFYCKLVESTDPNLTDCRPLSQYAPVLQIGVKFQVFIHLLYFRPSKSFGLWSLERIMKVVYSESVLFLDSWLGESKANCKRWWVSVLVLQGQFLPWEWYRVFPYIPRTCCRWCGPTPAQLGPTHVLCKYMSISINNPLSHFQLPLITMTIDSFPPC